MGKLIRAIYYFLPVQLFLLHFRRYQLLLVFWFILLFIVTGHVASMFGASTLFLSPEYLGRFNFVSMALLGGTLGVFVMMWNITTFIIHSKRIPYLGATRHAFLVYCFNNLLIPLLFLLAYSILFVRHACVEESFSVGAALGLLSGLYVGLVAILLVSFAYFFRVSRNYFAKTIRAQKKQSSTFAHFFPKDRMDVEIDVIRAISFISISGRLQRLDEVARLKSNVMKEVLMRHHRNVIVATVVAYVVLLLLGFNIENHYLRVPAGASFLLLFAIVLGLVGAFKYFMRSWETIGWISFVGVLSLLVNWHVFDLRSIAVGLDYHKSLEQYYHYNTLRTLFSPIRYESDKKGELERLSNWKRQLPGDTTKPPLVIITTSGGGLRAAYWTFKVLQYADSAAGGKLFSNTVMITGASGGMIGATYWRNVHDAWGRGQLSNPYDPKYQRNIGKDLLNSIVFSFASIDMISPFNKITSAGHKYPKDRGYAFERELARNSEGLLDHSIGYFAEREAEGKIPMTIINGTIVNDARKLMISAQPLSFLTRPEYTLNSPTPTIDAVDYYTFFPEQRAHDLQLTSALRMNATFPYILPVVRMPSRPRMNVMDAGLRDNFGMEVAARYLITMRKWMKENAGNVILLQIRDTRENDISRNSDQTTLFHMLLDPLFVVQNKWEGFQSYGQTFIRELAPYMTNGQVKVVNLQYIPQEITKMAALNFHLTDKERTDIALSVHNPYNQSEFERLNKLLGIGKR